MATSYILNCLKTGIYRDGVEGTELPYAGRTWWLPYHQVTPIPDFALREVDHDKSTPERGETGMVRYRTVNVEGKRLAEELTMKQIPTPNHDRGIQIIEGKPTGQEVVVFAGTTEFESNPIMRGVMERVATKAEMERCEQAADAHMRQVIADYFDSKRQRMTGGQGRNTPDAITRFYMELLNVEDNDDVTAHQKSVQGMTPEMLATIMEQQRKATEINGATLLEAVDTVRKKGKAQLSSNQVGARRKSLNLAQKKAERDAAAAQVEEPVKTEA